MPSVQKQHDADVREFRWALRMDKSQPELVVLERSHVRVVSIVENLAPHGCYAEHDARMSQAAVEEHVEFDQFVLRRVADDFAGRGASRLVVENEDVRADDVDVSVSREVVHLGLDALGHTHIVRVHPCDEVRVLIQGDLHADVK